MFQEFFANSSLLDLPLIALLIFFFTFLAVIAHVVLGSRKRNAWKSVASLPLEDEQLVTEEDGKLGGRASQDV